MISNGIYARHALAILALAAGSTPAYAQQIISAVESEHDGDGPSDTQVGFVAGQQLSTVFGGAGTRALTNFGVNKIAASGNAAYEQYATSAWLDSYTVAGTPGSNVTVSFTFSVDGVANYDAGNADFNFNIYALRGDGWAMSGYGEGPSIYSAGSDGSNYERLLLTQTVTGRVTKTDMRDMAQLCAGENCDAGLYPGTDLTLSFDLAAGSTFTLASFLYADDVRDGTIDFFNTAKVTGVSVSPGATLASQSGALSLRSDGSYGYPAAAPVPEPATWALMIGGFGLLGASARRRVRTAVTYA